MNYSSAVQKAKSERRDHRKAKSVATSVERRKLVRDSKDFITVEREHDPLRRFGGSLKSVYYDSDGDGYKDSYGRVYRSGPVDKPGVIVPSFGPIVAPVSGPSGLILAETVAPPASGPSGTTPELLAPASGPSGTTPELLAPANGPSGLTTSAGAPANGPSGLTPQVGAPVSGPSGLSTAKLTLNINIEASQDTIVAKTTEPAGTLEYASDLGYLFIYDGTDWHRTNGA